MIMKVINNTDQDIYLVKDRYIYKGTPTYFQEWELTGQMFKRLKSLANVNMISIFYVDEREVANNTAINNSKSQSETIEMDNAIKAVPVTTNFVNTANSEEINESVTIETPLEDDIEKQDTKKKTKKK